jgi:uncharacterized protein YggE
MKLIFTALLLCLVSHIQTHDIPPPLVSVAAVGEVRRPPDEALVSVAVEIRDVDLNVAREQTDDRASAIIAYLKQQNIADNDLQTSYLSLQPYYNYQPNGATNTKPDFYIATKAMTFRLEDLSNYDNIMAGLYSAGINRVDGITFRVTNEDQHKAEAKRRAVVNAKNRAILLTSELEVGLGGVYSINENSYSSVPVYSNNNDFSSGASADAGDSNGGGSSSGPSISAGEVVITSNVAVNFYITDS